MVKSRQTPFNDLKEFFFGCLPAAHRRNSVESSFQNSLRNFFRRLESYIEKAVSWPEKEVINMNNIKSLMSVVFLTGASRFTPPCFRIIFQILGFFHKL